eukprot:TRINITY_DN30002_c0_g1_i1.p1 TRINITY_DN30002_c0_g1~~TRINITY_DN30002_c0_g1_i1.p1  ORF type:complete len:125 (+),score=19.39 TRINITY_DN30002_c0_g1_i1:84-458(+)
MHKKRFAQCEHIIAKLMQRGEQMEYLFHEWSGIFPTLPANARQALAKGLLPLVGRCPHAALDFVLKELDAVPQPEGRATTGPSLLGKLFRPCSRRWSCGRREGLLAAALVAGIAALPRAICPCL